MANALTDEKDLGEINHLKEKNDELFYKLEGVMHFVDKWLESDELKQDEVNRAATMREKTLQIVEEKQAEIKRLENKVRLKNAEVIYYKSLYENNNSETTKSLARVIKDKTTEIERYKGVIKILENDVKCAKSEAIKEFADRLKETPNNAIYKYQIDNLLCSYTFFYNDVFDVGEPVEVYAVKNDKNGYPHFLIWEEGQWKYKKAKHFLPSKIRRKYETLDR